MPHPCYNWRAMQLTGIERERAKRSRLWATMAGAAVIVAWIAMSVTLFDAEFSDPGSTNALASLCFVIGGMTTGILVRGGWRASFWHSVAASLSLAVVFAILMGVIMILAVIVSLFTSRESSLSVSNIFIIAMVALLYPLVSVFLGGMLGSVLRIFVSRRLGPLFRR